MNYFNTPISHVNASARQARLKRQERNAKRQAIARQRIEQIKENQALDGLFVC